MKTTIFKIFIFLLLSLLSCTKKKDEPAPAFILNQERVADVMDTTSSPPCFYRIRNKPDSLLPGITKERVDSLKTILGKNNINYHNLQIRNFTDATPSAVNPTFHIRCNQFINGLLVFSEQALFHLKKSDSVLVFDQGRIEKVNIDSVPLLKEQDVVKIFIKALNADNSDLFSKDAVPKACFKLELGYRDLNGGTGISTKKYARCWYISAPIGPSGVRPSAYIDDVTSAIISYSNGVID